MRRANRVNALDIYLDELCETVLVEVQNQVVNEVEAVADDDKGQLVRELGLLEEVLNFLWVVEVTLPTNALNFADLASACCCLNVLKVDLRILAKVDDRAEVIVEAYGKTMSSIPRHQITNSPSKLLYDSNISMSFTGPRISEYFVAIWTTI